MRRYTTPIETFTVEDIDLTEATVYVTLKQNNVKQTYSGEALDILYDGTNSIISLHMTQEQTGAFGTDELIQAQINWVLDGERNVTDIVYLHSDTNLYDEVIE